MKKKSFLILLLMFLVTMPKIYATNNEIEATFAQLDQISDEALQMVELTRYNDAKRLLQYFSDKFLTLTAKDQLLSMDELRIVTVSHSDALEAVKDEKMAHEEKVKKVTQFRLATDAIVSSHTPLWTEMENQILNVLLDVREAAINGESELFHVQLNSFLSLYEVIYPSLKIDVPIETMQKLETRINFIDHYRAQVLKEVSGQHELEVLEADLKYIFSQASEEDEADPSLWWVIISTGSVILLSLSYVGWRKYNGTKRKEKARVNHSKKPND